MKIFKLLILLLVTLIITACGSGNTTDTMIPGKPYIMNEGEVIVKGSNETVVVLETDIETGVTTATLQSGSASIENTQIL